MKRSLIRFLWMLGGCLCLVLGTIGVILPILPTVPFYMATVFCFAKGSDKLHHWFLNTGLYKKHLESFATNKEMTKKTKISVMTTVTILMAIGFLMMKNVPVGRIILAIVWIFHILYFSFRIGTIKDNGKKEVTYD